MEDPPKRRESVSKDDLLGWDANGRVQVDNHLDLAIRFSLRSIASNQPTEPEVRRMGTSTGERRPNSRSGSLLTNQFARLATRRHQPRHLRPAPGAAPTNTSPCADGGLLYSAFSNGSTRPASPPRGVETAIRPCSSRGKGVGPGAQGIQSQPNHAPIGTRSPRDRP